MQTQILRLVKECENSAIKAWAEGRTELSKGPWLVYINPTNLCNNRCRVCAREKAMRKDRSVMKMDIFRKIVDELPQSVRKAYLMKQGEPFINRNLEEFVLYLREKRPNIHISFHTNGVLAIESRVRVIMPYINSLGVSISATDAETYRRVHHTNNFEIVISNLKSMGKLRMQMGKNERPHVFVDYVYQEANKHEKEEEVVNFFKRNCPGISSVDFHWAFNFQGEIEEANMEIYDKVDPSLFPRCVFPWGAMTFCHDGKISYCFVEPRENKFLGDITRQGLMEIWNGKEYQMFRKFISEGRFHELEENGFYCRKCTWLWSMRSQTPRNLNQGYSVSFDKSEKQMRFGDLLRLKPEEILSLGLDSYLKGAMHNAAGCLFVAYTLVQDEELKKIAREWLNNVQTVIDRYGNLRLWQNILEQECRFGKLMRCRYYSIEED